MKIAPVSLLAPLLLVGCSNQSLYNSIQANQQEECRKQPPGQQEQCFARIDTDYEEYERQRQEVLAD